MIPSIGRIVHYKLGPSDVDAINHQRAMHGGSGNSVAVGQVYPAMIVRTWGDSPESLVQLQVFLDGNDTFWATSRRQGENEIEWREPPRV